MVDKLVDKGERAKLSSSGAAGAGSEQRQDGRSTQVPHLPQHGSPGRQLVGSWFEIRPKNIYPCYEDVSCDNF